MRITRARLRQIISEEISRASSEEQPDIDVLSVDYTGERAPYTIKISDTRLVTLYTPDGEIMTPLSAPVAGETWTKSKDSTTLGKDVGLLSAIQSLETSVPEGAIISVLDGDGKTISSTYGSAPSQETEAFV
jgi:hypothetical protein